MSTLSQNRPQRARKDSERGAASKEYLRVEAAQVRKRVSKKDKENVDEAARAAQDAAMFQDRPVVARSKRTKPPKASVVTKPLAPTVTLVPRASGPAQPAGPGAPRRADRAGAIASTDSLPDGAPARAQAQTARHSSNTDRATARTHSASGPIAALERARPEPVTVAVASDGTSARNEFDLALPPGLAGTVKKQRKPRPVARDLDDDRAALVADGCFAFRALIAGFNPFPSAKAKRNMFNAAWQYALGEHKLASNTLPTQAEVKLVLMRTEQMRGNVKSLVRAAFAPAYGFRTPVRRQEKTIIAKNKARYNELVVRDAYVYTNPSAREGLYGAPIILDSLIAIWFAKRNDEGPAFPDLFNPNGDGIKLETIALILAAVQNCLDEWKTGKFQEIQFRETAYRRWYRHHLTQLQRYAKHRALAPICARLRKDMYRAGMLHCGAMLPKLETSVGITDEDLDAAAAFYKDGGDPSDTESESDLQLDDDDDVPVFADSVAATRALNFAADHEADSDADPDSADFEPADHANPEDPVGDDALGMDNEGDEQDDEQDIGAAEGNFFDDPDADDDLGDDVEDEDLENGADDSVDGDHDDEDEDLTPPPPKRRCIRM